MPDTTAQRRVQELIDQQVADERQIGLQVAVYHGEELVVDAAAGRMGPEDTRPVQHDSLFVSFSCTKGVALTAIAMLADRGELDLDAPVAQYWPAFGQHGKDQLTVAQAMNHQAGLHAMPSPFAVEHLTDWDEGIRRIEEGVPAYPPGTSTGYHAVTFAWIVGGIVQAVTGRPICEWMAQEIAAPLELSDEMLISLPDGYDDRLTTLETQPVGGGLGLPDDANIFQAMPVDVWPPFNDMAVRRACLPSANGHFTARALARLYAALGNGGAIEGTRLLSEGHAATLNTLRNEDVDIVIGTPIPRSVGFWLGNEVDGVHGPLGPRRTTFGHPGAGGSTAFADPVAGLGVAVTINKMQSTGPGAGGTLEITDLIREELGGSD